MTGTSVSAGFTAVTICLLLINVIDVQSFKLSTRGFGLNRNQFGQSTRSASCKNVAEVVIVCLWYIFFSCSDSAYTGSWLIIFQFFNPVFNDMLSLHALQTVSYLHLGLVSMRLLFYYLIAIFNLILWFCFCFSFPFQFPFYTALASYLTTSLFQRMMNNVYLILWFELKII